jgi:predicted component of type VI protein secretion system
MLKLTVMQAPAGRVQVGDSLLVGPEGARVGRGRDSTWRLADENLLLSRVHFAVEQRAEGFTLVDLSTNGVYLNGDRLGQGNGCVLRQGDRIRLGDYELRAEFLPVDTPAAAADTDATVSPRIPVAADRLDTDAMFAVDPEQWLLAQLGQDAPVAAPALLVGALEQVFGPAVRHCSNQEQVALVAELGRVLLRDYPDVLPPVVPPGSTDGDSAFARLLTILRAL